MKIKKFRIKNYKSIVDTDDCWLEDSLTIFAGKNESGKTSILEALEEFNIGRKISDAAKPLSNEELVPEISIVFTIDKDEINDYYNELGITKVLTEGIDLEIIKKFPDEYIFPKESKTILGIDENYATKEAEIKNEIKTDYDSSKKIYDTYFQQHGWAFFILNYDDIVKSKSQLNSYKTNYINSYISQIPDEVVRTTHLKTIQEIEKKLLEYEAIKDGSDDMWQLAMDLIPNFILFKSFEDNIPNEVSFKDLPKTDFIKDLELISNLDVKLILSDDIRKNQKHKDSLNININKEYSQYWSQDLTSIKIDWNSTTLFLWIVEEGEWYKPSMRSKGRQWHISFYTRVSARSKENRTNVILIDEPGMFLHASAQKDIYKRLLESSKNAQIAFTTHSPYLIDAKELHRVKLVCKKDTKIGTKIVNKIHAKADKETLTPILTAIGLELSQGIQNVNQTNNVIVEGPADVFYLNKMADLLNINGLNFIYGGGAGNMGNIGTILNGWGCKVFYLFDNDQGKKDGMKNLMKTWQISKHDIISISDDLGAMEDLFTKTDFKKIVLIDDKLEYDESNSGYLKLKKIEKVLLSKQFISNKLLETKQFSKETVNNFRSLFDKINNQFAKIEDDSLLIK